MFKLNLKIAMRNLWKNKIYTVINIGGLSIALAVFLIVILYVSYERGYDKNLPGYDRIYLVGKFNTDFTPAPLSRLIKDNLEEVEAAGKARYTGFEFAVNSSHGRVYSKKALQLDFETAKMFNIYPDNGLIEAKGENFALFLPKFFLKELFPHEKVQFPKLIGLGPRKSGQTVEVKGSIDRPDEHSNIKFDILSVGKDISQGNKDYSTSNFQTYILVRKGVDIANLREKIDLLYKEQLIKSGLSATDTSIAGRPVIFLDPLKNLHLKPKAGTDTNDKIVTALFWLSILIMVIACINFTNLTIAQATKRAKEVGMKKIMGAYRLNLMLQFLTEIFIQCCLAMVLGLIIAEALLPAFNNLFNLSLTLLKTDNALIWQLPLILFATTIISGAYPALVLSGYRPASVLKGNLQTSYKTFWLRNALLAIQFSIAVIFIIGLFIVDNQLKYMHTEDIGFKTGQVVCIKSIQFYSKPAHFEHARARIMKIPGVNHVTVASDIPDGSGSKPGTIIYKLDNKEISMDFLDVDFDYFETLNAKLKWGRFFSDKFSSDSINSAVINETAAFRYGTANPVGKTIRGCNMDYKIVGVVKDVKTQGFESAVEPTIYTINNPCNNMKVKIMVNIDQNKMTSVLTALKFQWHEINKLDGEDFKYEFLNELYGRLFKKQEQLKSVFFFAALLTIFIAVLGLVAFSAFIISNRIKEISVRKILGATDFQVFKLLNNYFIWVILLANLIACPFAYLLAHKWLEMFAYRIEITVLPFAIAILISLVLTVITISVQVQKALKMNPIDSLKYE